MDIRFFEIRDEGTHIPALAIRVTAEDCEYNYPLRRAGFDGNEYVLLMELSSGITHFNPFDWPGRTMPHAHKYLIKNWLKTRDGQVVDVRYILGETDAPCRTEERL